MRDYSKISSRFWTGKTGKQMRNDADAQRLALYLLTAPGATMIGVYYVPIVNMAHETGLSIEGASKALQTLIGWGFCSYSMDLEWVFVHEMARFQIAESLKANDKQVKSIIKQFQALPESELKQEFHSKYATAFHLGATCAKQAPPKALRSQEQEQKQKQEQEQEGSEPKGSAAVTAAQNVDKSDPEKREVWNNGRKLLHEKNGISEERAGNIIGKLVKDVGQAELLKAIRHCIEKGILDPHTYLLALPKLENGAWQQSDAGVMRMAEAWEVHTVGKQRDEVVKAIKAKMLAEPRAS